MDNIVLLCNCLRSILVLTPEDLLPAIYLSTNAVAPAEALASPPPFFCAAVASGRP